MLELGSQIQAGYVELGAQNPQATESKETHRVTKVPSKSSNIKGRIKKRSLQRRLKGKIQKEKGSQEGARSQKLRGMKMFQKARCSQQWQLDKRNC